MRSIRDECLDHLIAINERHLTALFGNSPTTTTTIGPIAAWPWPVRFRGTSRVMGRSPRGAFWTACITSRRLRLELDRQFPSYGPGWGGGRGISSSIPRRRRSSGWSFALLQPPGVGESTACRPPSRSRPATCCPGSRPWGASKGEGREIQPLQRWRTVAVASQDLGDATVQRETITLALWFHILDLNGKRLRSHLRS